MSPAPYRCTLPKLLLNIYEKYYINCIICKMARMSRGFQGDVIREIKSFL
jgi:hypothetical protein